MRFIFLIVTLILSPSVESQIVASSCDAPDSIVNSYKEDATLLALRRIYLNSDSYMDSAIIPNSSIDTVLNAMIAVYNATSISERDTVIDLYSIAPIHDLSLHSFTISADSSLAWMNQLEVGNLNTGFTALDDIIADYNFTQYNYYDWSWWYHSSTFVTSTAYNINAIIDPLKAFPQVYDVSSGGIGFDGPDLQHAVFSDHVELRYIHRWGDCPSGCMYQRTWVFKVYFDCSVEFVESYNGLGPDASLVGADFAYVSVGPNPTSGIVKVTGLESHFDFTVLDALGKIVFSGSNNGSETIDLSSLSNGTYVFQIKMDGSNLMRRIIKR